MPMLPLCVLNDGVLTCAHVQSRNVECVYGFIHPLLQTSWEKDLMSNKL